MCLSINSRYCFKKGRNIKTLKFRLLSVNIQEIFEKLFKFRRYRLEILRKVGN